MGTEMITLAIAGGIFGVINFGIGRVLTMFSVLFYLEDRAGVGIYDPDPRPHHKKK